jgi:phosphatidylglycerol:prolipoprotein diacylglycerol transferase
VVPILFTIGGFEVPTHTVFVILGAGVAFIVFAFESRRRGVANRTMWTIAAGSLLGGAILAKASTAWRYVDETEGLSLEGVLIHGGKSVVGGLAGAYLGAIVTKRILGFRERTGDVFAPAVALGIAVGRVGCLLTEQIGTPTGTSWGFVPPAELAAQIPNCPQCLLGVPLHPSFIYEIVFCVVAFGVLTALRDRIPVSGELFKLFLLGYGLFRFGVEFVRGNPVMAFGLTGTQIFLMATMPFLVGYFVAQLARGAYSAVSTPKTIGASA